MSDWSPVLTVSVVLVVYFLPAILAGWRSHHNSGAIFVLNLLLGWTLVGWVVALVWAFTNQQKSVEARVNPAHDADRDKTKRCPFCSESIKASAIKCRFCGSALVAPTAMAVPTASAKLAPSPPALAAADTTSNLRPQDQATTVGLFQTPRWSRLSSTERIVRYAIWAIISTALLAGAWHLWGVKLTVTLTELSGRRQLSVYPSQISNTKPFEIGELVCCSCPLRAKDRSAGTTQNGQESCG